jgi:hypothetical protein
MRFIGGQPVNAVTLESLAQRVEALERALERKHALTTNHAWCAVVGMFAGSDFMPQVDAEGQKIREAERAQAKQEPAAE